MNRPQDQTELVIRCQLGEPEAWEELVRDWHPRLWRFILHMLADPGNAEEVLQNVWLKVVRSLIRLRDPEKLNAWMYRIARAAVMDRLRKKYRQLPTDEFCESSQADDAIESVDLSEEVANGLSKLHPVDREVVVLHYLEERPVSEVAETCGVPVGTVKSRLHRARRLLRQSLETERN